MNSGSLKVFTVALAMMMVFSPAMAQEDEEPDKNWLDTLEDFSNCNILTKAFGACEDLFQFDYVDGKGSTVAESIATQMAFASDERKTALQNQRNYANRTYGIAISKAKITAIEALNDGESKATALTESNQDIVNFYSELTRRTLNTRNREILKINETAQTVNETEGINLRTVTDWSEKSTEGIQDFRVDNHTFTLPNGTDMTVYSLDVYTGDYCASCGWFTVFPATPGSSDRYTGGEFRFVDQDGNVVNEFSSAKYPETFTKGGEVQNRATSNIETVVEQVYANYDKGELDASEILGPLEATQLASTSYESTGKFSYASLSLEQMGLANPEQATFTVSWTENGSNKTKDGQLFVSNDYNSSLEANKSYTIEEPVFYIYQQSEDSAERIDLTGKQFTIEEIRDAETGDKLNKTTVQQNEFYTRDTTELQSQLESLESDIQELKTSGGFFGGFDGFGNFTGSLGPSAYAILALLLVIAGAYLA